MIAFYGERSIKEKFVARVEQHRIADEIIHGTYWAEGKGCAVGCTVHIGENAHIEFERQLGIPRELARLEDWLFEHMSNGSAKEFPGRFLAAIPVGADLSRVWLQWLRWLLVDEVDGVIRFAKAEGTKSAIRGVAELFARAARGEAVAQKEWDSARRTAAAAAADAAAAAAYAADAAAAAAYAYAAYAYAYAAAAAYAAYAAAAAAADRRRARENAYKKAVGRQAEKLLELLAAAPVKERLAA